MIQPPRPSSSRRPDVAFPRWRSPTAAGRLGVVAVLGLAVSIVVGLSINWVISAVIGWAVTAASFSGWVWMSVVRMDAAETRAHSTREDPSGRLADLLQLIATVASLVAVGFVLVRASSAHGSRQAALAALAVASVALSWLLVHTLYTLRYARLFYSGTPGGIDFNQKEDPRYTDFAYLAFTLGMTYQVSDTNLRTHAIRGTALRHSLLSYLFGSVILATTINLIVSLSSGTH